MNKHIRTTSAVLWQGASSPYIEIFRDQCGLHARLHAKGLLSKPTAVDHLQDLAQRWRLVEQPGQDTVQGIIAAPFERIRYELASDEPEPPKPKPLPKRAAVYQTAQSTIDAFWYVARNQSTEQLTKWLAARPLDAPHLRKLWQQKGAAT